MKKVGLYFLNIAKALDILVNTILAGKVRTISARIGQIKVEGRLKWSRFPAEWLIDTYILEPLDPGHSIESYNHWKKL